MKKGMNYNSICITEQLRVPKLSICGNFVKKKSIMKKTTEPVIISYDQYLFYGAGFNE